VVMVNVKIVAVGDGAVGKTSLLLSYSKDIFPEEYVPSAFDIYGKDTVVDGEEVKTGLWDTAGQEEFDRIRPLSYSFTDVFLLCFSVISPESLDNVKHKWSSEIKHYASGVPWILVGTKIDLRDNEDVIHSLQLKKLEPIPYEVGEQVAKQLNANVYMECSSKTRQGLTAVFETAIRFVLHPEMNQQIQVESQPQHSVSIEDKKLNEENNDIFSEEPHEGLDSEPGRISASGKKKKNKEKKEKKEKKSKKKEKKLESTETELTKGDEDLTEHQRSFEEVTEDTSQNSRNKEMQPTLNMDDKKNSSTHKGKRIGKVKPRSQSAVVTSDGTIQGQNRDENCVIS